MAFAQEFIQAMGEVLENEQGEVPALVVRKAFKSYKSKGGMNSILNNYDMTVEKGTIYSLLGSSGCGKTTILSCCVGLKKLDKGKVFINGAIPGTRQSGVPGKSLGYMPQEISLVSDFTILETLQYFGRLYGMTSAEFEGNTKFLTDFLKLPDVQRTVGSLSGGQQRRVSFAVALIHNPELLILDEPTVGVDPLLRQSIWDHLVQLVSTGKTTVIITTHYIEEARGSHAVGLMRNGRLLVEECPNKLLEIHNTNSLENVVLKLCLQDKSKTNDDFDQAVLDEESNEPKSFIGAHFRTFDSMCSVANGVVGIGYRKRIGAMRTGEDIQLRGFLRPQENKPNAKASSFRLILECGYRLRALIVKNAIVSSRNILFLFFSLVLPAIQIILVGLVIGSDVKNVKFGVINHDFPGSSFNCDVNQGCSLDDKFTGKLSCRFLRFIPRHTLDLVAYATEDEAVKDIRLTILKGYMSFPPNFTQHMKERVAFGSHVDIDVIRGSRISMKMDMTSKQTGVEIKKALFQTLNKFMRNISTECGINPENLDIPLVFDEPVFGDEDAPHTNFLTPSLLVGVLFFFQLCGTSVSYIIDSRSGMIDRTKLTGATTFEIMTAYSLIQLGYLLVQTGLSFSFMVYALGVDVEGPGIFAYLIAIIIGITGVACGFLLTTIVWDELQAVLIAIGTFMPNFLLAGMLWPLEGMPIFLQYFAYLLPCTLACEAMRSVVSRGVGFLHPSVWPGFVSSFMWIVAYCLLTVIIYRFFKLK